VVVVSAPFGPVRVTISPSRVAVGAPWLFFSVIVASLVVLTGP